MKTLATFALLATMFTGCTHQPQPVAEVQIGEPATVTAPESGLIPAIAQDAGGPVEELR
jgi:PBP1b-binding outer membrane lipoprotein LpoB